MTDQVRITGTPTEEGPGDPPVCPGCGAVGVYHQALRLRGDQPPELLWHRVTDHEADCSWMADPNSLPYPMVRAVRVLYLDLDGTVREGKDDPLGKFVNGPDDVRVFPAAVERMRAWKADGGRIVAVTNQGGISLGFVTMQLAMDALAETNRQCEDMFDLMMMCQHHPNATDPEYARCWCRKPRPGLVIEGALELTRRHRAEMYPPHLALFVGDRPEDRACAEAANIDFIDAAEWRAG